MSKIILSKSKNKGKRLKVEMSGFDGIKDHTHHFGSDIGQSFIDHKDPKKNQRGLHDILSRNSGIMFILHYFIHGFCCGKHLTLKEILEYLLKCLTQL